MQKNYPSIKRIAEYLEIDKGQATFVRRIMDGREPIDNNPKLPNTNEWLDQCYHRPKQREILMEALCEAIGGYGIGMADDLLPKVWLEYVNMGDTYSPTICLYNGRLVLSSWGDIVEKYL